MRKNINVKAKNVKKTSIDYIKRNKKRAKVLGYLGDFLFVPQIARILHCKENGIYRIIQRMVKDGLITDTKRKLPTKKGYEFVKNWYMLSENVKDLKPNTIRLHKIQFDISILNEQRDWNKKRKEKVTKIELNNYKEWTINESFFQQFYVEEVYVRLNNKGVSITLSEINAPTSFEAKNIAINKLYELLPKIERMFNIKLMEGGVCNVFISDQHNALILNELAKFFYEARFDLKIYDEVGNLRAVADRSKGYSELEFVSSFFSEGDASEVKELIKDTITKHHLLPSQLTTFLKETQILLKRTAETQYNSSLIENNILTTLQKLFPPSPIKPSSKRRLSQPSYLG